MKVYELLELLEGREPEADVMIAHQPTWPLAERLSDVTTLEEADGDPYDWDDPDATDEEKASARAELDTVWLIAGGADDARSPYAPRALFER